MAYQIILKPSAQRDLDGLPDNEVLRILKRIEQLREDPRPIGTQKLTAMDGYRIRIGAYRVLFVVNDKSQQVLIYRIKHRKSAYR